jgi:hypothetical protein
VDNSGQGGVDPRGRVRGRGLGWILWRCLPRLARDQRG